MLVTQQNGKNRDCEMDGEKEEVIGWGGDVGAERPRQKVWGKREREEDELDKGEEGDDR